MDKKNAFDLTFDCLKKELFNEIVNRKIIATIVIQEVSPYLSAKIGEFFCACRFKKVDKVSNTWIFKSLSKNVSTSHKPYIIDVMQSRLSDLCSFNSTEFPIYGFIHISGDIQGH